jgi:hypothetical protein
MREAFWYFVLALMQLHYLNFEIPVLEASIPREEELL